MELPMIPNILTIVLALFLSPALPEEKIKVGDSCEQAMAVAHEQGFRLVDAEYLSTGESRFNLPSDERLVRVSAPIGVLTLAYDKAGSYGDDHGKKHARGKAGFILCGLVTETDPTDPPDRTLEE